jgi:hypothetical protein
MSLQSHACLGAHGGDERLDVRVWAGPHVRLRFQERAATRAGQPCPSGSASPEKGSMHGPIGAAQQMPRLKVCSQT